MKAAHHLNSLVSRKFSPSIPFTQMLPKVPIHTKLPLSIILDNNSPLPSPIWPFPQNWFLFHSFSYAIALVTIHIHFLSKVYNASLLPVANQPICFCLCFFLLSLNVEMVQDAVFRPNKYCPLHQMNLHLYSVDFQSHQQLYV